MSQDDTLKDLCAVALHIYSTNDPCYNCGSSIQYVIQTILREEVERFIKKIAINADHISTLPRKEKPMNQSLVLPSKGIRFSDDFSVFAIVSSSKTYGTPFHSWARGTTTQDELNPEYFSHYSQKATVHKGSLNILSLNGRSLYFWVPSLVNIELAADTSNGFSVTVKQNQSGYGNFYQLINVVQTPQCLRNITSLDISGTDIQSAGISYMLQNLTKLVSLNIDRAIVNYEDEESDPENPREQLFESIGELEFLEELSVKSNNINTDEFLLWFSSNQALINIMKIDAADNYFFNMTEESIDEVREELDQFIREREGLTIDLTNNGQIIEDFKNIQGLTAHVNPIAQSVQQAVLQRTELSQLTDEEWSELGIDKTTIPLTKDKKDFDKRTKEYRNALKKAQKKGFLVKK